MIRDDYTRARSNPDSGSAIDGSRASKMTEIRNEYKKARKILDKKDGESESVMSSETEDLTDAEKRVARRLANDLMILSKIARKRSKTGGERGSTNAVDMERTLELLDTINNLQRRRPEDESIGTSYSDDTNTEFTGASASVASQTTPQSSAGGVFDWLWEPEKGPRWE